MSINPPPDQDLPIFNPIDYLSSSTDGITREYADENYLKFPIGQGTETIPVLNVSGATTIGVASFQDVNPAYEIKYPVNSGRIDFYSNTSGGVSTRGLKVDATGVHTISKFDTIDETAGTLNIGTLAGRTGAINIGTGSDNKSIILGNQGTTTSSLVRLRAFNIELNPAITNGTLNLATFNTGGSITMGGTTGGSTTIDIGTGTAQTGAIKIGTGNTTSALPITIGNATGAFGSVDIGTTTITVGKSNTATNNIQTSTGGTLNLKTTATGGAINIGNTAGGTITINRPLLPAYTGTTPASTEIGYKADIAGLVLATNYPTGTANITTSSFSIPNGVWLVNIVVKVNFATGLSGAVYLRLSLSTVSGTSQDARTIDFNPNDTGNNYLNYTTTIATATATNYFLVGASGGSPNPSITSAIVNITRIA